MFADDYSQIHNILGFLILAKQILWFSLCSVVELGSGSIQISYKCISKLIASNLKKNDYGQARPNLLELRDKSPTIYIKIKFYTAKGQ